MAGRSSSGVKSEWISACGSRSGIEINHRKTTTCCPVAPLPPEEANTRSHLAFRRFIAVFARPEHPLALFLDDLQWLDAATLDFLEDLLVQQDVAHLLVVGAYRDNEVDPMHPLIRRLSAIRQAGGTVREIHLKPLGSDDLARLITDTLHCDPRRATSLAQLV